MESVEFKQNVWKLLKDMGEKGGTHFCSGSLSLEYTLLGDVQKKTNYRSATPITEISVRKYNKARKRDLYQLLCNLI